MLYSMYAAPLPQLVRDNVATTARLQRHERVEAGWKFNKAVIPAVRADGPYPECSFSAGICHKS
eukprot:8949673-Karenia_brevis.AAC.1